METIIIILLVAFVIGLLSRKKGDSFLDTLGSGCGSLIWIVVLLIIGAVIFFMAIKK